MNDSTLLQHACELAAMSAVSQAGGSNRFHLYSTHAGPTSVPLDSDPPSRVQLSRFLNLVAAKDKPLPAGVRLPHNDLIDAYARVGACPSDIPNTARLLAKEAHFRGVTMTAVLFDDKHEADLREALHPFRVYGGSWHKPMARLRSYDAPWLLSFTPPKVSAKDLGILGAHVRSALVPAGHAGIVCVLARNLDNRGRESFWDAMVDGLEALELEFVAVKAPKNRVHVVGMACVDAGLIADAALAVHDVIETTAAT